MCMAFLAELYVNIKHAQHTFNLFRELKLIQYHPIILLCASKKKPSPPHAFITLWELINEADFQLSSWVQTVQLCILESPYIMF